MRHLGTIRRERLVVVLTGRDGVERQVELVFPPEFEPGLRQRVVPRLRARVAFGQVSGMRGDLVRDHTGFYVFPVRQPEMLLGRDVAEHRRAIPANHGRADGRREVVIARRDIGRQGPQCVEGRLVTPFELSFHVLLDEVHRDVARSLVHHLDIVFPRDPCQLALRLQLCELGFVVRVGDRSGPEAVAEREGDVVPTHDLADLTEVRVGEILLVMGEAPLRHD